MLTGSWISSRKLNRLSTWQKINFKCTLCGFLSRRCKNVENVHETFTKLTIQKFPFKNVLYLTIEYTGRSSSFFRNLAASVGSKQAKRSVTSASSPTSYVVDHVTFVEEGGMGDFVWVRTFFPNLWS